MKKEFILYLFICFFFVSLKKSLYKRKINLSGCNLKHIQREREMVDTRIILLYTKQKKQKKKALCKVVGI